MAPSCHSPVTWDREGREERQASFTMRQSRGRGRTKFMVMSLRLAGSPPDLGTSLAVRSTFLHGLMSK